MLLLRTVLAAIALCVLPAFSSFSTVCRACSDHESYFHWLSTITDWGTLWTVDAALTDTRVYLMNSGFEVLEVTPEGCLVRGGGLDLWGAVEAISDEMAVVGETMDGPGVSLVSAADPDSPRVVGSLSFPCAPKDFCVTHGFVVVADQGCGLKIIDVHDPRSPFVSGVLETTAPALRVCSDGSLAYLWTADGLFVIDVDAAGIPSVVGTLDLPSTPGPMVSDFHHVYLALGARLQAVSVEDPTAPALAGSLEVDYEVRSLALGGETMFVAMYSGLDVVDIANAGAPKLAARLDPTNWPVIVASSGGRMYLEVRKSGYHAYLRLESLFGLDGPHPLPGRWSLPTTCPSTEMRRFGPEVLVGSECGTQFIRDPRMTGEIRIESIEEWIPALGFVAADPLAYMAVWPGSFVVYNLSDLEAPVLLGSVPTGTCPREVEVAGSIAYVGCDDRDIHVIDVQDPSDPRIVGSLSLDEGGSVDGMDLEGSNLYVQSKYTGYCWIVDVSDPAAPRVLARTWGGSDVAVRNGYAYFASNAGPLGSGTLGVVDCRDPATPVLMRDIQMPDRCTGIAIDGGRLYLASPTMGLFSFDLTDPELPRPIGWSAFPCNDVTAENGEIFAYSDEEVVRVPAPCPDDGSAPVSFAALPPEQGAAFTLGPVVPNPSRGPVTIHAVAPFPSGASAAIIAPDGRLVRRLGCGRGDRLWWDGRDASGHLVPSGSYTGLLRAGNKIWTVTLQRIR